MCKDILYKPTAHQKHQWKYHKQITPNARQAEKVGSDRYESFDTFSGEIFHRMYADNPQRVENPAQGTNVFQKLDGCINEIPELIDLKRRCTGDEFYSGLATTSIIDEILKAVPAPDQKVENPTEDQETIDYLKNLLQEATDQDQADSIQEALNEMVQAQSEKVEGAENAADSIEAGDVRNAIRRAAKEATEQIKADKAMVASFMAGDGAGQSATARKAVAGKLRGLVQHNDRLKKIAELAGRLKRLAADKQRKKPQTGNGQIDGVTTGNSLKHLVPSEMLYMDSACENHFIQKYMDRTLLNWELKNRNEKESGPIVMLLDSSGSMGDGSADAWAAAVCLAFMDIAKKQGRAFSIVHFNRQVLRTDVWKSKEDWSTDSIVEAIDFFTPSGGTDFMPAIDKGIEVIKDNGSFKKADIVMVTDGYDDIEDTWKKGFDTVKSELEFNLYSILVGGAAGDDYAKTQCSKFSDDCVSLSDALKDDKAVLDLFGKV